MEILKETRFPIFFVDFFDFRNLQVPVIVSNSKALAETLEKISSSNLDFLIFQHIFWFFQGHDFYSFGTRSIFFLVGPFFW